MNTEQLKTDIFDVDHPEKQLRAAYQMRYVPNDPEVVMILARACYEARDPRLQQESVRSWGVLQPERAFEAFRKSTHNSDSDKRMRAYYHLGTLGKKRCHGRRLQRFRGPGGKSAKSGRGFRGETGRRYGSDPCLEKAASGFRA